MLLTEEHTASLVTAFTRHSIATDALRILQRGNVRSASWPDVAAAAVVEAKQNNARLLVVDTLPAWSLGEADKNSASEAVKAMRPLSEAAREGLAVLVVRHQRKGGGDVVSAGRGSSAFAGEADIVATLQEYGARATVRRLEFKSRFEETPASLVIEWKQSHFVSHGDGAALAQLSEETTVLDTLPHASNDAIVADDVVQRLAATSLPMKRTKAVRVLERLVKRQVACRGGSGTKNDPFVYLGLIHSRGRVGRDVYAAIGCSVA